MNGFELNLLAILFFLIFSFSSLAEENKKLQTIEYWQGQILENPSKPLNYFNLAVVFQKKNSIALQL